MSDVDKPMVTISQEEYAKYKRMEREVWRTEVQLARDACTRLEDDIDTPLKDVVAMLSLLGCRTIWSCCGFDYNGQPAHKFHEYGAVFVRMFLDQASMDLLCNVFTRCKLGDPWKIMTFYQGAPELQLKAQFAHDDHLKMWNDVVCPHYSEPAVMAIASLERALLGCRSHFAERVTVEDTNAEFRKMFSNWQYTPKESWTIERDALLERLLPKPILEEC